MEQAIRPQTLQAARFRNGWTQRQLAQICGLTQTTISHLERGKTFPKTGTRKKLENLLGSIDWQATKDLAICRNN